MYLILLALIKDEEPKFKIKALIKLLRILKEKYFSSRLATRKKKEKRNSYMKLMAPTCHRKTIKKKDTSRRITVNLGTLLKDV